MEKRTGDVNDKREDDAKTGATPAESCHDEFACGCHCTELRDSVSMGDLFDANGAIRCSCTICGPWDAVQRKRRCQVVVSPLVAFCRFWQNTHCLDAPNDTAYCEDCRDYCLLQIRIAAVRRSRAKRMRLE